MCMVKFWKEKLQFNNYWYYISLLYVWHILGDTDAIRRQIVKDKTAKYLKRAEQIYNMHLTEGEHKVKWVIETFITACVHQPQHNYKLCLLKFLLIIMKSNVLSLAILQSFCMLCILLSSFEISSYSGYIICCRRVVCWHGLLQNCVITRC